VGFKFVHHDKGQESNWIEPAAQGILNVIEDGMLNKPGFSFEIDT